MMTPAIVQAEAQLAQVAAEIRLADGMMTAFAPALPLIAPFAGQAQTVALALDLVQAHQVDTYVLDVAIPHIAAQLLQPNL
jgi:hypothetical protein